MNLSYFLPKNTRYIIERELDYWQTYATNHLSSITANRAFPKSGVATPRWRGAELDLELGILTVPVPSAKDFGKWDDRPNYTPKETEAYTKRLVNFKGDYLTSIQWPEFYTILQDWSRKVNERGYHKFSKKDLINMLFSVLDVRFDCTCPAFYWQGMQYELGKINSAIERTDIPSRKWIPKHKENYASIPICKHIFALLYDLTGVRMKEYLYGLFYRTFKKEFGDVEAIPVEWDEF